MLQGIIGAFFVRIPAVYIMKNIEGATLFHIGLGTPISTVVQIILCIIAYKIYTKNSLTFIYFCYILSFVKIK